MTWRTSDYGRLRHSLSLANAIDRLGESGDTLPPVPTHVTAVTHSPDHRDVTSVTPQDLTRSSIGMADLGYRGNRTDTDTGGNMDTQATQALRVEGLTVTVQADALREAVATLIAEHMATNSPTQVDETQVTAIVEKWLVANQSDDHISSIAESIVEDKMPSGYDDPTDHYDMSDYVTTSNVEDYVQDALRDNDTLAHGDDLRETDENVADLTERVAKLEARWTALITALTGSQEVQEVA